MIFVVLIFLALLAKGESTLGAVFRLQQNEQTLAYQCLLQSGYTQVTEVIFSGAKQIYVTSIDNLYKAKNVLSNVDMEFVTCRGRDPVEQVKQFMLTIPSQLYSTVWLIPWQPFPPECSINGFTPQQNCDYLQKLITQFTKNKVRAGIVANSQSWNSFAGQNCNKLGNIPLYWNPDQDGIANFSNFKPFGGWLKAEIKLYKWQSKLCGVTPDLQYRN